MVNSLYYSLALWWQGRPDDALNLAKNGFDIAQDTAHPYSIAFAHTFNARLRQSRGEVDECLTMAEAAIEMSTEHGFPLWLAYAGMMKGWALAQRGELDEALALFEQGLKAWSMMGALIWRPYYLALYAEVLTTVGEFQKAGTALDEAAAVAARTNERLDLSYFERLRGQLLWAQADADAAARARARNHFREALRIADESHAKAWQLEQATWVARTAPEGPEAQAAKERLAEIYAGFAEGQDTPRLQAAAELLSD
jgi:predicted ATPase